MSALDPAQQSTETIYDRLGGDVPVTYEPPRAVNLERFTVLQAQGPVEVSLPMTDGVELSAWTIDDLTAFLCEVFGGPPRYSRELGGFDAIVAVHRGLRITEEQRQRFIALFTAAFERVGHGDDPELRDAVLSCIEFGTEVAKVNSNARSDAELHP